MSALNSIDSVKQSDTAACRGEWVESFAMKSQENVCEKPSKSTIKT